MKNRLIHCCVVAALAVGLLGCSAHPLPQDISYASTVDVVRRIRCEGREGLETALEKAASQGDKYKRHVERIIKVSTIGFEFKLIMAEDNRAAVNSLTFKRASSTPGDGFTLELIADLNKGPAGEVTRKNTRIFRVVDRLEMLREARCGRVQETRPNLIHPITGSTGMAEVVRTYIELEALTDLGALRERPVAGKKEIVAFSDKLDFTTTLEAGATTDWEFSTKVGTLRLTKASLAGSALRKDLHSVTAALARDDVDPDLPESAAGGPKSALTRQDQITRVHIPVVRDKKMQISLIQRASVARNRVLIELERRRQVDEDRDVASRVLGITLP